LIAELARRGLATVAEPGRRIVAKELAGRGAALPWVDPLAFAHRALAMAMTDRAAAASLPAPVFFDRGPIDAAAALEHLTGEPWVARIGAAHPANRNVFLAPPWPEIHVQDDARRHGIDEALAEYIRLKQAYAGLGATIHILPKVDVSERADFVLEVLRR
jgi:predicted ATPase